MIVPCRWTPVPLAGLIDALQAGHHRHFGYPLPPAALPVVVAQLELEHGVVAGCLHGVACFNLGNIDATDLEIADPALAVFETVPEHEVLHGGDTTARHWRRAYEDATDGARGYFARLAVGFPDAYAALWSDGTTAEIARAFVVALKGERYFTGNEAAYLAAVERLAFDSAATLDGAPAVDTSGAGA